MYQSLYRRYRPQKFEDVVGQEKVVEILQNQINKNMVSHAYLFTGVRGTGKTSIAKIFAKSLNCLDKKNGSPCNCCKNCKIIQEGNNIDIVEMDAASNNGVDDIRLIREEVNFLPTVLKYRVYIIDEVHMLSQGAFNALLKTLEEPPEHVKFILATTEPQKLPATILSRCQRFEFLRIPETKILKQLRYISKDNNIDIDEEALILVSNLANGSMRDGISILESVSNISGNISQKDVRKIVGIPDKMQIIDVFKYILKGQTQKVIEISNNILDEGKEPLSYITEILKLIQVIYLEEKKLLELYNSEEKNLLTELRNIDKLEIYKLIQEILELIDNIKYMEDKKSMLILGLLNITEKNKTNSYFKNVEYNISKDDNNFNKLKEDTLSIEENSKDVVTEKVELVEESLNQPSKDSFDINDKNIDKSIDEDTDENIDKNENEIVVKNRLIDVLAIRKKFLKQKETGLFVALSNVLMKTEGLTIKIFIGKEKEIKRLNILNDLKTTEKIIEMISKEHNCKYKKVEYILNEEEY